MKKFGLENKIQYLSISRIVTYCQLKVKRYFVHLLAVFPDIDECLTEEHNCSHVAVCNNTIGSYNCTCQEGYVGDGQSCSGERSFWMSFILHVYNILYSFI